MLEFVCPTRPRMASVLAPKQNGRKMPFNREQGAWLFREPPSGAFAKLMAAKPSTLN